jgi:uncharacterized delta-60 repeat protein
VRRGLVAALAAICIGAVMAPAALARAGDLDPSFSGDGRLTFTFPDSANDSTGDAVLVQPDHRILVVGSAFNTRRHRYDLAVARLLPDGRFDRSFSSDGMQRVPATSCIDGGPPADAALQDDGKLVVAGYACSGYDGDIPHFAVARLDPDGRLDRAFSKDGRRVISFAHARNVTRNIGVDVDSTGRIVVAGTIRDRPAVARLMPHGKMDRRFSRDGKVRFRLARDAFESGATDVAVQADDRIVVTGFAETVRYDYLGLARLNVNGHLDHSFAGNGRVTERFDGYAGGSGVAVQSDGKIAVGGTWTPYGHRESQFGVARFEPDGSLDPTFSGDGFQAAAFNGAGAIGFAMTLQPGGRIVVAGDVETRPLGPFKFALARFRADGELDPSFGGDGRVTTRFPRSRSTGSAAFGVAAQSGGKIVAAGDADVRGKGFPFAAARYLGR